MPNLDKIFHPQSIALVGASNKEGSVGSSLIKNLIKAQDITIYPINLKDNMVAGLTAYPSLSAVASPIDLMIIAVPAAIVPNVLEEGGKLGIKAAVIISAGFKEVGNIDLENKLIEICKKYDITLIGPNCLGIINPYLNLNASFASADAKPGKVAFISQSGAICTAVLDSANKMGIGFSKFMSVGNKATIDELAIFDYLANDDKTEVIALYAEQMTQAEKIMASVKKMSYGKNPKPLIVLKSGRSVAGASASASHTGALAGNDAAYSALFSQAGIIRADKTEELFDFIKIFSNNPKAPAKRLAIITNAGGPGVIAVDCASAEGLEIAELSEATKLALSAVLPPAASTNNPVDVLGDAKADRYYATLEEVLSDSGVDSVLVILTPQSITDIELSARAIVEAKNKYKKPLAAAFMGDVLVAPGLKILNEAGVAAYSFPEDAVKALRVLDDFYNNSLNFSKTQKLIDFQDVEKEKVAAIFAEAKARGQYSFPEANALAVLAAYKLPVLTSHLAKNREEAINIAKNIGKQMVFKIVSQDILHKSDVGGIMLSVMPEEASDKFDEMIARVTAKMPEAKIEGVLLVEMITEPGVEMILGSVKDASLGSAIMLGLGGIYVEIFKDVVFGLNPLSSQDVLKMINKLKSAKLLEGARGAEESDRAALVESVLRLAKLLTDFPEIIELDINPLLVLSNAKGVKVLDARIVIS